MPHFNFRRDIARRHFETLTEHADDDSFLAEYLVRMLADDTAAQFGLRFNRRADRAEQLSSLLEQLQTPRPAP